MALVPLSEALDTQLFGGKAVQLGTALRSGLPVPEGFALDYSHVLAIVKSDRTALAQVRDVCGRLEGSLAVRSSAVGEDSAGASFAGQHATLLNVNGTEAVIAAIKEVYRSGQSEGALAYRRRVGAEQTVRVGVVIQRLIAADVSGVLFTCNPINGKDERVVEASWGLGEAIVQGLVIPDRYRMSRGGAVIERVIGTKDVAIRRDVTGMTRREPVQANLIRQPCLTSELLHKLDELATRCDGVYGPGPHDIEWAIEKEKLYLLQRRPVTTVAPRANPPASN